MTETAPPRKALPTWAKMLIDFGPLVVFFVTYNRTEIFTATVVFMVATVGAAVASWVATRHVPVMLVVTLVIVLVFGGLTIYLHDERFIKVKPTIVYTLFAVVLLGGLAFGKSLLAKVFDFAFTITEEGWRKLTLRWGLFFVVMAAVNEIVWRNFAESTWVSFKLFGFPIITFLFAMSQVPLIQKHTVDDEAPGTD
ncbi:septation protein A [Prosthecomicrobium sp. N25]|uniref:septation protein A n=1 Tax=Prosthecomicrobium sp. N25 TaxID=3129254 RepID=UPI0030786226